MREITYRDLMINDLQKLRDWQFSITQMQEELATLDSEYSTIKATNYDKMPVGSGENTQEEKLISAIAKIDQKREELKLTKRRVKDIERLLDHLTEDERTIIRRTILDREPFERIASDIHCDIRQVYNKRNSALAHLVRLRHGAVYHP